MQVLKDEIRYSILRTAKVIFMEHGFEGASMKAIASSVGVSVGNLYRYYPQKEALFDAVTMPAYETFQELILGHENMDLDAGAPLLEKLGDLLTDLLNEHRESLLILLYGSKGTKHEGMKTHLFEQMAEHLSSHIQANHHKAATAALGQEVARPIAVAFLEGYFEIIRLNADKQKIREITKQYVAVWFMGLHNLM